MATSFASAQDRVNSAVKKHLANAVASVPGREAFNVCFDDAYQAVLSNGMESTGPACEGPVTDLGDLVQGSELTIAETVYRVVEVQPDGTGWVVLILELAE